MKKFALALAVTFSLLLVSASLFAHHGEANYDTDKVVAVKGTVTDFQFINPHTLIMMDVKNDKGEIEHWDVEMMSLNHLKSYGWTHSTVQVGDVISCTGGKAKSGAPAMISSVMKLGDGRTIKS